MLLFMYILAFMAIATVVLKLFKKFNVAYTDENVNMSGKVVIVTGCNTGIGFYTAKILAKNGAHVIMAVRSLERGQNACALIKKDHPNSNLTVLKLDLGNSNSVLEFVRQFEQLGLPLHVLINNAGIASQMPREDDSLGLEPMFATNHLGHYLLTKKLLPHLVQNNTNEDPGRIVIVSSNAHAQVNRRVNAETIERYCKFPMMKHTGILMADAFHQYSVTKLCNVLHCLELDEQFKKKEIKNVTVNCLHPGEIKTDINREMNDLPWHQRVFIIPLFALIQSVLFLDVRAGSQTSLHAATSPELSHVSGQYLHNLKPEPMSELAQDVELRRTLIDLSEKFIRDSQAPSKKEEVQL